ncbi:MAG: EpsG family protein [Erysipelotrichaceae bacterium]|nr:EpsG family protein [Erysipelotrichaceae bacterium]
MRMILGLLIIITGLAYLSQRQSMYTGKKSWDIYLVLLFIFLVLFAGLRTSYNDTSNYINGFVNSETIGDFISNSDNLDLLNNPLFYGYQALIRTFTDNYTIFFMISAIIVNYLFLDFIKKNTDIENFAFSIFIYVCLGTLMLSIAAQKQILTMSILTLALNQLFDKHYVKFYIIVFIAGLIHTYAWLFLFLPLLDTKPWSVQTLILIAVTIFIMMTFQSTITSMLEVADQVGKDIPVEEVFDSNQMNILRVAVYSIVPITSLLFKGRINNDIDRKNSIFIQMSIVSLMFMLLGTMNGANMFGRAGNYFQIGMICSMPWIIRQLFTKRSVAMVLMVATLCFSGFYLYDNNGFDTGYNRKSITQFIGEVI